MSEGLALSLYTVTMSEEETLTRTLRVRGDRFNLSTALEPALYVSEGDRFSLSTAMSHLISNLVMKLLTE